ncbi:twin-arginine translocase TatA/TatE family subunit [Mycetocola sp. 2940]|uniref:twin-arginine translocase TatA/TatE family subunit n=1 Tax=Mycetocola sp. 2940 TaxID=3156452 RepID=UPI0033914C0E
MGIFGNAFSGWHLLVIVFLVLLLFGAPKLPALAKSVGQSMKIFKSEIKTDKDTTDLNAADTTVPPVSPTATQAPADPTIVNPGTGAPGSQTKP